MLERTVVVVLRVEKLYPWTLETVLNAVNVWFDTLFISVCKRSVRATYAFERVPRLVERVENVLAAILDNPPMLVDKVEPVGRKRRMIVEIVDTFIAVCVLRLLTAAFNVFERRLVVVDSEEKTERRPVVLT